MSQFCIFYKKFYDMFVISQEIYVLFIHNFDLNFQNNYSDDNKLKTVVKYSKGQKYIIHEINFFC
jgi:hypothetical protein